MISQRTQRVKCPRLASAFSPASSTAVPAPTPKLKKISFLLKIPNFAYRPHQALQTTKTPPLDFPSFLLPNEIWRFFLRLCTWAADLGQSYARSFSFSSTASTLDGPFRDIAPAVHSFQPRPPHFTFENAQHPIVHGAQYEANLFAHNHFLRLIIVADFLLEKVFLATSTPTLDRLVSFGHTLLHLAYILYCLSVLTLYTYTHLQAQSCHTSI